MGSNRSSCTHDLQTVRETLEEEKKFKAPIFDGYFSSHIFIDWLIDIER